jgi:hypothetical protein
MTLDQYQSLTDKEKLMYDELARFAGRLTERMEEIAMLLKKAIGEDAEGSD